MGTGLLLDPQILGGNSEFLTELWAPQPWSWRPWRGCGRPELMGSTQPMARGGFGVPPNPAVSGSHGSVIFGVPSAPAALRSRGSGIFRVPFNPAVASHPSPRRRWNKQPHLQAHGIGGGGGVGDPPHREHGFARWRCHLERGDLGGAAAPGEAGGGGAGPAVGFS